MNAQESATEMIEAAPGRVGGVVRMLVIVSVLWVGLGLSGFPYPHVDDLYYTGAGLNMAGGGALTNPLVEDSGPFYAYPPLHSYVIAAWLKVFGISAASMVMLHLCLCWCATLCVVRGFQLIGKEFLGWFAAMTLVAYFTCVGMRPDDCGLFFMAVSFWLGVSRRDVMRWVAPLFAFLAMAALPTVMALALPWVFYLWLKERRMWKWVVAGGCVAVLIVSWMLHWKVREFLVAFLETSKGARVGVVGWVQGNWYTPMGMIKIGYPLAGLCALVALAVWRRGWRWVDAVALLSGLLGMYGIFSSATGNRVMELVTVIGFGLYFEVLSGGAGWGRLLIAANGLLIIGSSVRPVIQGITTEKPRNGAEVLREVDALAPARTIVDQWSLRYVFDERIRPGMISLEWSARPGCRGPHVVTKYPDECWVLSAEAVGQCVPDSHGLARPRAFTIAGRRIGQWTANAGEIGIAPPGK